MPVVSPQQQAALDKSLDTVEQLIPKARAYMSATGMNVRQFAKFINRGRTATEAFFANKYHTIAESDVLMRRDVQEAMLRHPVTSGGVVAGRLYDTENVRAIRRLFNYCLDNHAITYVYGPPGSQKTFVFDALTAEFNRREIGRQDSTLRVYVVRASIDIRPRDLVAKICREIGAHVAMTLQGCLASLRQHLRGTRTLIILDEAQLCGIPSLEAVRELHDMDPYISLLLGGSHSLKQFFDTRAAELEQWNSRIHHGVELAGVSEDAARAILSIECPDLPEGDGTEWIEESKVADMYSRKKNSRYISMRRLFHSIAGYQRLAAQAEEAAA